MAVINSIIPPFPDHIDRDYFGAYLSGFVDGEGSFGLYLRPRGRNRRGYGSPDTCFAIGLRSDDLEILETIRSYFGVGLIGNYKYKTKESKSGISRRSYYTIRKVSDLEKIVIPNFEKHPLLAKKQRDFLIWKEAVHFVHRIQKISRVGVPSRPGVTVQWTRKNLSVFSEYMERLKLSRKHPEDKNGEYIESHTKDNGFVQGSFF